MMHTSRVPWRAVNPVWRDSWICALAQSNWNLPLKTNHKRSWSVSAYVYNQKVIILSPSPREKQMRIFLPLRGEMPKGTAIFSPSVMFIMWNPHRNLLKLVFGKKSGNNIGLIFSKWIFFFFFCLRCIIAQTFKT